MITTSKNAAWLLVLSIGGMLQRGVDGFSAAIQSNKAVPPMPFKWPVVGTLPDFMMRGGVDRFCDMYEEMYQEYGNVYGNSIMGEDCIILCDPYAFDTVLRKEGKFPIGASELATTFVEYYAETNYTIGIKGTSRGPGWKEWRSQQERDMVVEWEGYMPAIASTAAKISKVAGYEITEQKNIAFVDFLSRASFDMFSSVMYGESPQTTNSKVAEPKDIEFVLATQTAFDLTGEIIVNPLEKVFETDTYQSFKTNMDKTFAFGYNQCEQFVGRLKQKNNPEMTAGAEGRAVSGEEEEAGSGKCPMTAIKNNMPFIERLVNRGQMSVDDIQSGSGPLLMAGVDTTTYLISWLYLNLASNPDVQTALAQELDSVLGGADVTTAAQMKSLPYLQACIRESHRLTPTAPTNIKVLKQEVDVEVDGKVYHVPAEQKVYLNLRAFPMDPKFVENPTAYQPERFMPDAVQARKGTPSEVIDHPAFADAFGRGKRRCLGSNVAVAEIAILTARLFQDYEISLADPSNTEWKPKQKLMLKADPYPEMRLVPRENRNQSA